MTAAKHKPGDKVWVVDLGKPCEVVFVEHHGRVLLADNDTSGHPLANGDFDVLHDNEINAVMAAIEKRRRRVAELSDDLNDEVEEISSLASRAVWLARGES